MGFSTTRHVDTITPRRTSTRRQLTGRWTRTFLFGATATIVLTGVVFRYFGRAEQSARLTYDNVRRLSLLMPRQEVEVLLGSPVLRRSVSDQDDISTHEEVLEFSRPRFGSFLFPQLALSVLLRGDRVQRVFAKEYWFYCDGIVYHFDDTRHDESPRLKKLLGR